MENPGDTKSEDMESLILCNQLNWKEEATGYRIGYYRMDIADSTTLTIVSQIRESVGNKCAGYQDRLYRQSYSK